MLPRRLVIFLLIVTACLLIGRAPGTHATGLVFVTNTDDNGPGSLRQTIADADPATGILFADPIAGQTIELESPIVIDKVLGIDGGAARMTLEAINETRVLEASSDMNVANLIIKGGVSDTNGGGILVTNGQFNFHDASVIDNSAAIHGGGIYVEGTADAILNNILIDGNSAGGDGGGLFAEDGVSMDITLLTISNNEATDRGGGLFMGVDTAVITATTISGNQAADGGGIFSNAFFGFDGTVSGNLGGDTGGGLYINSGEAVLRNATISGNTSGNSGSGIYQAADINMFSNTITNNNGNGGLYQAAGHLQVQATIIADQANFTDCVHEPASTIESNGYNLDSDGSCHFGQQSDIQAGNAYLEPLADNGGFVRTHELRQGSDALNRIPELATLQVIPQQFGCGPELAIDARGISRPQSTACDIGAFELEQEKLGYQWGHNTCQSEITPADALAALAYAADVPWESELGCIGIGAFIAGDALPANILQWSDVNCDAKIDATDGLLVMLAAADMPPAAAPNCPFFGNNVNLLG